MKNKYPDVLKGFDNQNTISTSILICNCVVALCCQGNLQNILQHVDE